MRDAGRKAVILSDQTGEALRHAGATEPIISRCTCLKVALGAVELVGLDVIAKFKPVGGVYGQVCLLQPREDESFERYQRSCSNDSSPGRQHIHSPGSPRSGAPRI